VSSEGMDCPECFWRHAFFVSSNFGAEAGVSWAVTACQFAITASNNYVHVNDERIRVGCLRSARKLLSEFLRQCAI
jgi:hypothetical protein